MHIFKTSCILKWTALFHLHLTFFLIDRFQNLIFSHILSNLVEVWNLGCKGQIISKRFFLAKDSSKKRTKTRRILVKTNSFVRFLGEYSA